MSTIECTCPGPRVNTHVDGNGGHSPGCPAHPANRPHARFLTAEDGEPIWILQSAFASPEEGLRAYVAEYGSEWDPTTPPTGDAHMRATPTSDDPDWHETVEEADHLTALYWRFDA